MLSACSRIVKAMGAQIIVESETNTGTGGEARPDWASATGSCLSFSLNFPKASMPDQPEEIDFTDVDFTGKRVLIADDVSVNREILKFILDETGIDTIEAKDGKEAVDIFLANPESIDLILMDIMMPNMDGYEATHEIRASGLPNSQTVPIIAVTALSYKEDVDAAMNAGMNSHIEKPVEPKTLLITLKRFLVKP